MNSYERAVIEAARAWSSSVQCSRAEGFFAPLADAVGALQTHHQHLTDAGTAEIEWSLVAAGDELRGKSGAFFPVLRTRREYDMGKYTGKFVIEIGLPGGPRKIVRPHGAEPFATVKRGPDGAAVDEFVNVFSSGE